MTVILPSAAFSTRYVKCKKHPRYSGVQHPQKRCDTCWWLYFESDSARKHDAIRGADEDYVWESEPPM
jgi:hypothetical protein